MTSAVGTEIRVRDRIFDERTKFDILVNMKSNLPPEDWDILWRVFSYIDRLEDLIVEFDAAVQLRALGASASIKWSELWADALRSGLRSDAPRSAKYKERIYSAWMFMAFHAGATTIYDFCIVVREIVELINESEGIRKLTGRLSEDAIIGKRLPDFWSLRNAVSHRAENALKPDKHSALSVDTAEIKSSSSVFIGGSASGDKDTVTVKKSIVSYELNDRTTELLEQVLRAVYGPLLVASRSISNRQDGPAR